MLRSVLLLSMALAAALAAPVSEAGKVPVEIMIESFCPCSGAWEYEFYHNLLPQIGDLVSLDRFFDASSSKLASQGCCNPSNNASSSSCFHKIGECVADRLQACAQAHYPEQWLAYTVCINGPCRREGLLGCKDQFKVGTDDNLALEKECAANLTMSWDELNTCWTGSEGVQLMQQSADRSDACGAIYGYDGLPVVWINGTRFSKFEQCSASDAKYQAKFIAAVCAASSVTPLPSVCNQALRVEPAHPK